MKQTTENQIYQKNKIINPMSENYTNAMMEVVKGLLNHAPERPEVVAAWIINAMHYYSINQQAQNPAEIKSAPVSGERWGKLSRYVGGVIISFIKQPDVSFPRPL